MKKYLHNRWVISTVLVVVVVAIVGFIYYRSPSSKYTYVGFTQPGQFRFQYPSTWIVHYNVSASGPNAVMSPVKLPGFKDPVISVSASGAIKPKTFDFKDTENKALDYFKNAVSVIDSKEITVDGGPAIYIHYKNLETDTEEIYVTALGRTVGTSPSSTDKFYRFITLTYKAPNGEYSQEVADKLVATYQDLWAGK